MKKEDKILNLAILAISLFVVMTFMTCVQHNETTKRIKHLEQKCDTLQLQINLMMI